ncbi:hypothetical protein HDV04_005986 [Boothiomyces sp. JEL0838]|nr:hypothetical protein HDV04_005986 [Boothiomyces sp. JEL0838]
MSCLQLNNSICSPYNYKINTKTLSKVYKINIQSQHDYESILSNTNLWSVYLSCPEYKDSLVQYYLSFMCMTDIFIYSKDCNNYEKVGFSIPISQMNYKRSDRPPRLCDHVCDQYGLYTKLLLGKCLPTSDPKIAEIRSVVENAGTQCREISQSSIFDQGSCILGVDRDIDTCGFGYPSAKQSFCRENPNDACCAGKMYFGQSKKLSPVAPKRTFDVVVGILLFVSLLSIFVFMLHNLRKKNKFKYDTL